MGKYFFEIFAQFRQALSNKIAIEAGLAPDPVWTSWRGGKSLALFVSRTTIRQVVQPD
jgi:hypothetical protein